MPIHLRPTGPVAPDALLPGDPGRAMALAQALFADTPKMSNHHRGLWGYWGETPAGRPLTIQATGMGGPSAAIVLHELAELGVRRAVRVGTCGALDQALELGDLVVAEATLALDGAAARLSNGTPARADPDLTAALTATTETERSLIASVDLFYDPEHQRHEELRGLGARAVEMEAGALFAVGLRLGLAVGCVLVVSDVFEDGERHRIDDERLGEASERAARAAEAALSAGRG